MLRSLLQRLEQYTKRKSYVKFEGLSRVSEDTLRMALKLPFSTII